MRIGLGFDLHKLVEQRKLILGGIEIPHPLGCLGHSDGDVLIHALIDALLGAAALGDIGFHFPDTQAQYKDIAGTLLLEKVAALLKANKFEIINLDGVLVAEEPKLNPYFPQMKTLLAKVLEISEDQLNLKAKTAEGTGVIGEGKAIAGFFAALLKKEDSIK